MIFQLPSFSVLIATFFLIQSDFSVSADKLLFVHSVWRHGDRTPTYTYHTDPNQEDAWPEGFGQLTAIGMKQQFELGQLLRQTYMERTNPVYANSGYELNSTYNSKQIYVRSTDVNRTLMSAYSNLAGMFQDGISNVTYPNMPKWPAGFSPIPVHTIEHHRDTLLNMDVACPNSDATYDRLVVQSDEWKQKTEVNQDFLDFITNATGSRRPMTLDDLWMPWDAAYIERIYNLPQPEFMQNQTIFLKLQELNYWAESFYFKPHLVSTLRGGPLIEEISTRMMNIRHCNLNQSHSYLCQNLNKMKYYAYSAHDTTLMALLRTFQDIEPVVNVTGTGFPKYAAAVLVELWKNDTDDTFYIKVLYQKGHYSERELMLRSITHTISGCPNDTDICPLDTFIERSRPFFPVDWYEQCYGQKKKEPDTHGGIGPEGPGHLIAIVGLAVVCVALLAGVLLLVVQNKRLRSNLVQPQKQME